MDWRPVRGLLHLSIHVLFSIQQEKLKMDDTNAISNIRRCRPKTCAARFDNTVQTKEDYGCPKV